MTHPLYESLDASHYRHVFICGDIHGEYHKLFNILQNMNFNENADLLISVGDLVDRGPYSDDFAIWINRPWFKWVLGNHDLQPREYLLGYESEENVRRNGGSWLMDKSREEIERIASLLEDAPLALELLTPGGYKVGITHADMHARWHWLKDQCQDPGQERYLVNLLTGSRDTIKKVQSDSEGYHNLTWVHGIDHVFHGHTPLPKPLTVANRTWIDTGAFDKGGVLTVIDVDVWLKNLE